MTYPEKLKDPRWQRKRLEILELAEWKCCICKNSNQTLHVHHDEYNKNPWDALNKNLHCVCDKCHQYLHKLGIKYREWEEHLQVEAFVEPLEESLERVLNSNKQIKLLKLDDYEIYALTIRLIIELNANTEWNIDANN